MIRNARLRERCLLSEIRTFHLPDTSNFEVQMLENRHKWLETHYRRVAALRLSFGALIRGLS